MAKWQTTSPEREAKILELHEADHTVHSICQQLEAGRLVVLRILDKHGKQPYQKGGGAKWDDDHNVDKIRDNDRKYMRALFAVHPERYIYQQVPLWLI